MSYGNIPAELKAFKNWVLWKRKQKTPDGRAQKMPYSALGLLAKTNKPETWTDFDNAAAILKGGKYDGLGFVFTNTPYVGVDLDGCFIDGELSPTAKEIVELLDGYTEYSPSGKGLHIIVKASLPKGKRQNSIDGMKVEMYGHGSPRYFTMTGNIYDRGTSP